MTSLRRASGHVGDGLENPLVKLLTLIIAVSSFSLAWYDNYKTAEQGKQTADHLRHTVCGIIQPYAATPGIPAAPSGQALKNSFIEAEGPQGASCTPDPNDGK